jgi:nitroreductase
MDAFLAIASKRDLRDYAPIAIPDDVERRILEAGRIAGSSQNKQAREFVVVEQAKDELADAVYAPHNVASAQLVVAIVGNAGGVDIGRAAQNMMLAAWNDGVVSCPNGVRDAEVANRICGGEVKLVLSFGYPAKWWDPDAHTAEDWLARAKRKPFGEVVRRV